MASILTSIFQASSLIGGATNLFSAQKRTKIGSLVLDACLSDVIALNSTITEHPIETKESISDHIFKNPLRIKIEGYITDSPIKIMGVLEMPLQNNSVDKLLNSVKSFLPFNAAAKPSIQAYQLLKKMHADRQLLSIVTKLDSFNNMAIENITFNSDVNTGERLEFTAELMQISFSTVKKSVNTSYKDRAIGAISGGKSDNGSTEKPVSAAKSLWESTKEFFTPSKDFFESRAGAFEAMS